MSEETKSQLDYFKDEPKYLKKVIEELQQELQKYKDMESKGLEEFKEIGGCWGCGLQLQLNQDIKDISNLKEQNETLKRTCQDWGNTVVKLREEKDKIKTERNNFKKKYRKNRQDRKKYQQTLKEIRERCNNILSNILNHSQPKVDFAEQIKKKIDEVLND